MDSYSSDAFIYKLVQNVAEKLSSKYQVKGIPHFVILDGEDMSVYTLDGRQKVLQDKYGLEFPWQPRTLMMLLPKPIKRLISQQLQVNGKALL